MGAYSINCLHLSIVILLPSLTFFLLPFNQARPRESHEKYLIRSAFDVKDSSEKAFLPSEVLWRPKEAFSDGVSSQKKSWFQILQDHIDKHVTDKGKLC